MISLLHEKEYELLGEIEIRQADWERLRQLGLLRFVVECCRTSFSGRVGALLILSSAAGIHGLHHVAPSAWLLLSYGAFSVLTAVQYAVRAWFRLERRFTRHES